MDNLLFTQDHENTALVDHALKGIFALTECELEVNTLPPLLLHHLTVKISTVLAFSQTLGDKQWDHTMQLQNLRINWTTIN